MKSAYDNRVNGTSDNLIIALDGRSVLGHSGEVIDSASILEQLKDRGITQTRIGEVLGIAQSNAARLYVPPKDGSLRKLSWDEGCKLIEEFGLDGDSPTVAAPPPLPNEAELAVVLEVILAGTADMKFPDAALRPAASALRLCLELLRDNPAIHANYDAARAVALAVVARPRDPTPAS